jgi:choline dehydrogenase-like flavoprotein
MNAFDEQSRSLWMDTVVAEVPALAENRRADTVVVGSGIAGLSTAYELACRGQKVLVLDPIRAWELLDGIPSHHVIRFHEIAPMSAPKMTTLSITSGETIPVPTVCATVSPKNRNAMKLKNAAHATAYWGRSTRVETMVAIELAAS